MTFLVIILFLFILDDYVFPLYFDFVGRVKIFYSVILIISFQIFLHNGSVYPINDFTSDSDRQFLFFGEVGSKSECDVISSIQNPALSKTFGKKAFHKDFITHFPNSYGDTFLVLFISSFGFFYIGFSLDKFFRNVFFLQTVR